MGTICDSETNGYKTLKDEQKLKRKNNINKKKLSNKNVFFKKVVL